jgi:hypothetical protein
MKLIIPLSDIPTTPFQICTYPPKTPGIQNPKSVPFEYLSASFSVYRQSQTRILHLLVSIAIITKLLNLGIRPGVLVFSVRINRDLISRFRGRL